MSKLKRKRVSVAEESKPERKPEIRGLLDSLRNPGGTSSSRSCSSAGHDRGDGGEPWWSEADLTAEEKVWVTLQGFCPEAFSSPGSVYCVPELPQLLERAEEERPSEWRWCRLDEVVPELPALKGLQSCTPNRCTKPCIPNNGSLQCPPSPVKQLSQTRHKPEASTSHPAPQDNPNSSETRHEQQASSSLRPLEDNPNSSETRHEQQAFSSQRPLEDNPNSSETRHEQQASSSQRPLEDKPNSSETRHEQQASSSQRPLEDKPNSSETRHEQQASSSQRPLKDNLSSRETRNKQQASSSLRPLEDNQKSCLTPWQSIQKPNLFREGESQLQGSRMIKKSQKSEGGKTGKKVKLCQGDTKVQTTGHHTSKADHGKVTHLQEEKMLGGESERRSGTGLQCESESRSLVSKVGSAGGAGSGSGSRVSSLEINSDCRPGTSSGGRGAGPAEPKLECCPMCLMPFPAGFSQMDCDGHLAQCLSEMNMDMVW